jgi:outer membrane protein OmpA-like peptidoglycan-associated protein
LSTVQNTLIRLRSRLMNVFKLLLLWLVFALIPIDTNAGNSDSSMQSSSLRKDIPYQNREYLPYRYGAFALVGANISSSQFKGFPGYPSCCPEFTSGSGVGYLLGGFYEYKLLPSVPELSFGLRAGLANLSSEFKALEQSDKTTIVTPSGATVQAKINHTITTKRLALHLEPLIQLEWMLPFRFSLGLPISVLIRNEFDGGEKFADDQVGSFSNNLRERNVTLNQPIPQSTTLLLSSLLSVGYDIPINKEKTVFLSPTISFQQFITPMNKQIDWTMFAVFAGAQLRFHPLENPTYIRDTIIFRDTTNVPTYDIKSIEIVATLDTSFTDIVDAGKQVFTRTTIKQKYNKLIPTLRPHSLSATLNVQAIEQDGKESNVVIIRIDEVVGYSIRPLLPYVFFEPGSSIIPDRYSLLKAEQTSQFSLNNLRKESTLGMYHNMMNVVASRLRENPKATITITGCNTNLNEEANNANLSQARADSVARYFTNVWGIDAKRIKVKHQNLPSVPSSNKSDDGINENRRTEITASSEDILQNVTLLDTILRTETISSLRFYPSVKSTARIKQWEIKAAVSDSITKVFSGTGTPPNEISWDLNQELARAPRTIRTIAVNMIIRDTADSVRTISKNFPIELITKQDREKVNDKYVDKYSLILYDFGTFTHTNAHKKMITYIKEHSTPESTFIITGHADRSGNNDYNKTLSTKRAEFTAQALGAQKANVSITGYGEDNPLYDNELPEGRMYNRTVNIIVETPVKKP